MAATTDQTATTGMAATTDQTTNAATRTNQMIAIQAKLRRAGSSGSPPTEADSETHPSRADTA